MAHPFIVGERYQDRRGTYTIRAIDERGMKIEYEYEDGTRDTAGIEIKARIYKNMLAELRAFHPLQTDPYFYFLGFLAKSSEFNAEVPPQSQAGFEGRYLLVIGSHPALHQSFYSSRLD